MNGLSNLNFSSKELIPRLAQKCEFGLRQSLGIQPFFQGLYIYITEISLKSQVAEVLCQLEQSSRNGVYE